MGRITIRPKEAYTIIVVPSLYGDYQINRENYVSEFPRGKIIWEGLSEAMEVAEIGIREAQRHYDNSEKTPKSVMITRFSNRKIQILMEDK